MCQVSSLSGVINKELFLSFFSSPCRSFVCKSHLDIQLFVRILPRSRVAKYILIFDCSKYRILRTFARKFSNIDFFLKILPLKDDELVMSEM